MTSRSIAFVFSSVPTSIEISFSCTKSPCVDERMCEEVSISGTTRWTFVLPYIVACSHVQHCIVASQAAGTGSVVVVLVLGRWQSHCLEAAVRPLDAVRLVHLRATELLQLLQEAAQHRLNALVHSTRVHGKDKVHRRQHHLIRTLRQSLPEQIFPEIPHQLLFYCIPFCPCIPTHLIVIADTNPPTKMLPRMASASAITPMQRRPHSMKFCVGISVQSL